MADSSIEFVADLDQAVAGVHLKSTSHLANKKQAFEEPVHGVLSWCHLQFQIVPTINCAH